jgi:hypothetical protein
MISISIGLGDEDAAVFVAEPLRDDFEVDAGFDGVAAKEVAHGVVSPRGRPRRSERANSKSWCSVSTSMV